MRKSGKANSEAIASFIRRSGVATAPELLTALAEVRTDLRIPYPKVPAGGLPKYVLGAVTVEWVFHIALDEVEDFVKFLVKNEQVIADDTESNVKGCRYLGTYFELGPTRLMCRTFWSYDTSELYETAWKNVVEKKTSKFYRLLKELRSYWTRDPNSFVHYLGPAVLYEKIGVDGGGNAFLALTIDAAKSPAGRVRGSR